jgi:GNAT superfamily N-acetyltransferase
MNSRPYSEPDDLRAMQRLAQEVWQLEPSLAQWTVGELAWSGRQHVGREPDWKRQLWLDGDRVVAWGRIELPASLEWQVHPESLALIDDVLDWFEAEAETGRPTTSVRAANEPAAQSLRRRGWSVDPDAPWILLNARSLDEVERARVPDGYRLTTLAEVPDLAARVAVHRAAFHPSRVTEESYANVVETWPYRSSLDCAVLADDGSFASYALGWLDEQNAVGELEPVGTHPHHRRRGLASAVCLFALTQMRAAGAGQALVGSRGDAAYPVPKLVYESIGFRELSRSIPFVKD